MRYWFGILWIIMGLVLGTSDVRAQSNSSFLDLWCQYGGENCGKAKQSNQVNPQVKPSIRPVKSTMRPVPKRYAPQRPVPKPARVQPVKKNVPVHKVAPVKKVVLKEAPKPKAAPIKQVQQMALSAPLIRRNAKVIKSNGVSFGQYYALVIGNNVYPHMGNLKTAVGDAQAVAQTLAKHYGFSVTKLFNASRDQIISALDEYRKILKPVDNLLIYYAGHGWLDKESERGYWLAVDANKNTRARWVSNADITDTLKALKARHVMVVADSCYSGSLSRASDPQMRGLKLTERPPSYLETLSQNKSRTVMSSGSLEPVTDAGGGKHSVFAYAFLKSLRDNQSLIDGTELFGNVRKQVLLNARQTPQYSNIRFAGHDVGGDFVFIRRDK